MNSDESNKEGLVLGGGSRWFGKTIIDLVSYDTLFSFKQNSIADVWIDEPREHYPYESQEDHKYFTPKKREMPSSLFENLLRRV